MRQKTLLGSVRFEGVGLHSGKRTAVVLKPAPVGSGIVFRRRSGGDVVTIPAVVENVVDTRLATVLGSKGVTISTVEHLLSAITTAGIDNVVVDVHTNEIPILDGSARDFYAVLSTIPLQEQKACKLPVKPAQRFNINYGDAWISIAPAEELSITYTIDFEDSVIGRQTLTFTPSIDSFEDLIAPARTFTFEKDVKNLQAMGLALGGSLDNAIVVSDDGILNKEKLRFADEFVRHKILDLIGDLALLGRPLCCAIHAHKSGHELNRRLVSELAKNQSLQVNKSISGHGIAKEVFPPPLTNLQIRGA